MQDFVRGWIPCVGDQSRKQFPLFEPRAEMPGRRARRDGSREREEAGLEEFIGKIHREIGNIYWKTGSTVLVSVPPRLVQFL